MTIKLKQRIILLIIVLFLAACGFKLRGQAAPLPFKSLYITAPEGQIIGTELERVIRASSRTKLAPSMADAEATLEILNVAMDRSILSLSGGGRVRDFNLIYRVTYRVLDHRGEIIAPQTDVTLTRILPFLDALIIAKESEERLLQKDMQTDAVQQILWRLSAIKFPPEDREKPVEAEKSTKSD
ncbi:MAG: LPS-assembly lipoprotein LptE [Nitrosomonas sp.]